jgi:phytoene desaturase
VTCDTHDDERPLADESAVVVGAGLGGLSAACHLADRGADVEVIERNSRVGGVASRIETGGFRFDTGPSWYLMPETFERFFDAFDRSPEDYYDLTRLDPQYRLFWRDGDRADVPADLDAVRDLFESYEDGAAEALDDYLASAAEAYEVGTERFVYEDRSRLRDLVDVDVVRSARGLSLLGTMDDHVAGFFDSPKLRQIVQYSLVFLGGAPHNTPALYSLMSYVDLELGVYYPEGGMYSVVEGVAALATELGAAVSTGETVVGLDHGPTVETDRRTLAPDRVVCNANPAHVERDLLPPEGRRYGDDYWDSRTYAPSAFLLYLGVEGSVDPLAHHSLVLPEDWGPHFASIFDDPAWPDTPSYYVNVPSATDETVAPDGCETVVVLVPVAPGLDDDAARRAAFRDQILDDLECHTGVDLRGRIVVERQASVSTFADRFALPEGTALGLAHTLRQTGPLRPSRRGGIDGLYYTGAFTGPGIGVPMVLLSGEQTADAVVEDAGGSRLPRVARSLAAAAPFDGGFRP